MTTNSRLGTGYNTVRWIVLDFEHSKMVSPSQKKSAVAHAVDRRLCSVRRACTYLNLPRSIYRYAPKQSTDRQEQLYQRVIALS